MDCAYEVIATRDEAVNRFHRQDDLAARSLAAELEKEGFSIEINGEPFLNFAGPDGLYLHQSTSKCPMCSPHGYTCARCTEGKGEFYSVKPTHYHSREVDGFMGHAGIHDILCYDCHREDRLTVYGPTYGESQEVAA